MRGAAGEFFSITWPGYVGALTAMGNTASVTNALAQIVLNEFLQLATAFAALGVTVEMLEKKLGHPLKLLTPDEVVARAKTAPPEEKKLLENLGGGSDLRSGLGWGTIQMYFRLSAQEMAVDGAGGGSRPADARQMDLFATVRNECTAS